MNRFVVVICFYWISFVAFFASIMPRSWEQWEQSSRRWLLHWNIFCRYIGMSSLRIVVWTDDEGMPIECCCCSFIVEWSAVMPPTKMYFLFSFVELISFVVVAMVVKYYSPGPPTHIHLSWPTDCNLLRWFIVEWLHPFSFPLANTTTTTSLRTIGLRHKSQFRGKTILLNSRATATATAVHLHLRSFSLRHVRRTKLVDGGGGAQEDEAAGGGGHGLHGHGDQSQSLSKWWVLSVDCWLMCDTVDGGKEEMIFP